MSNLSLPTERRARLAALTRLHAAWENLWLAARGANPQWTARNAERSADEARVRRLALKMLREATRMFGTPNFLAQLGQRLWSRTGKAADPRMIASLKRALLARVDEKAMERLRRGVVHELARAAERSESWTRDSLGLRPLTPWSERAGFRKQVSEWIDVEGVFVQEYPELVNEINGNLTTAVGSHAEQVSHTVVNAANPARPRPIGEVSRDIRQQLPGMSARRSNMIARTETARSYGRTTHDQYKRNGIERRRTLTAAGSPAATLSPVCDICIDMASQGWVNTSDPFESRVSSVSADYAPYHPYCRCDTTGDVEGWLPPTEDLWSRA